MFGFNRSNYQQYPANRALNKILTYGLVFFIAYAIYTNKNAQVDNPKPASPINYTYIDWSKYAVVKNLLTNKESLSKIDDHKLVIDLSRDDLKELKNKTLSGDETLPVYEIKIDSKPRYY